MHWKLRPPQALIDAVCDAPDDDGPRLVLADWLSERGDPHGELIVLQCRLAGRADEKLRVRERELMRAHQARWLGALGRARAVWRRGFVSDITIEHVGQVAIALEHRPRPTIWLPHGVIPVVVDDAGARFAFAQTRGPSLRRENASHGLLGDELPGPVWVDVHARDGRLLREIRCGTAAVSALVFAADTLVIHQTGLLRRERRVKLR